MKSYFEQLEEKRKIKEEFKEKLAYSTEYIDWLDKFLDDHGSFSTNTFKYHTSEQISDEDRERVDLLEAFFEATAEYCDDNYISPIKTSFGGYYSLSYNGNGYYLGVDTGQGTSFYCAKLKEPEKNSLEYKHIMSGVKLPRTIQIDHKLERLVELIEELDQEDVPVEAIHQKTDTALQKIRVKRQRFE